MPLRVAALVMAALGFAVSTSAIQTGASKKGYLIGRVDVLDPTKYDGYREALPSIIEQFGGRYLARGGRTVTLEGPEVSNRVVIIEFPSVARAQEFYRSAAYESARQLRAGAAVVSFVVVEGL